ncbi:MAG: hypothetical protein IJ074_01370 [Clostridia bacterium]|nr:hypothetical protein [Clostridia bacterium]
MTKIVLTRSMLAGDIRYICDGLDREVAGKYEFIVPEGYTEEALLPHMKGANVLLGPYVTHGLLEAADQLQLIQIPWTGMDTFDFSQVQNCQVPVCNTHSNADAVAELGVALALDLLKKLSYHDRKMRAGNWNRDQQPLNLKSGLLSKQTVCVLGFGNIGSRIGALMHAFGAKVIAVDDRAQHRDWMEAVYPNAQIAEAVAGADVIMCTLPLTEETRGRIGKALLERVKPTAILVNMSRAPIVDEDALWDALTQNRLAGFAADVWWNAPKRGETQSYPSAKHEFWKLDQVTLSPHRAGFVEGCLPHLDGAIENIIALIQNKPLKYLVDVTKGF